MLRVAPGGQDHAAGVSVPETDLRLLQALLGDRAHDGEKIALQQRQHHLGLRIAEAAVVLDDLRPVFGDHQAKVEAALEGAALGVHGPHRGQEDLLHAALRHRPGVIGVGGDGAHAAGVETGVAVAGALMVHGGHHGHQRVSVGEGQNGDLRPLQVFLDDHAQAAVAELFPRHHVGDGLFCLLPGGGDDDALAQGQPVGLDHGGDRGGLQIGQSLLQHGEAPVFGGGDAVAAHQVLGKYLAALDDGGVFPGTEAGDALGLQRVHAAQHQGIVRGDHGVVDLVFRGKGGDAGNVLGPDGDADRVRGDAAVAGQSVNLGDLRVFLQLFNDGVFPPAAADDHDFHGHQWWNRRMWVKHMTMPYLSQASMTRSSRMEPPGWAM